MKNEDQQFSLLNDIEVHEFLYEKKILFVLMLHFGEILISV